MGCPQPEHPDKPRETTKKAKRAKAPKIRKRHFSFLCPMSFFAAGRLKYLKKWKLIETVRI